MSRYLKKSFISRLAVVATVLILETFAVHLYAINQYYIKNIKWDTVAQSYVPSWQYSLANHTNPPTSRVPTKSVPVLVYHGLIHKPDQVNTLTEDFRKQMFALKDAGYQTISMDQYVEFTEGKISLPQKAFLLTFDDGRKDSYYEADPILRALNYRATMFVIAHHAFDEGSKSTYYLNKTELLKMVASKQWDIEAHTYNGHDLMPISRDGQEGYFYSNYRWLSQKNRLENDSEYKQRVISDLRAAKQKLEDNLNIRIRAFAYPFGDYGQDTSNNSGAVDYLPKQVGKLYDVAFAQEGTSNDTVQNYFASGGRQSTRIEPTYDWTPQNLMKMIQIGTGKDIPYADDFHDITGWKSVQGAYTLDANGMNMRASTTNTSNEVLLDGTQKLSDYRYEATIDWQRGKSVAMLSRYQNASHYLSCNFGDSAISIIKASENGTEVIKQQNFERDRNNLKLWLQVQAGHMSCGINDHIIVESDVSQAPSEGMVGFSIWDPVKGNAEVYIKQMTIKQ